MSLETKEQLQNLIGDDYRLQWIIGHGGMSTVWLADDTRNQREVAIKFLRPEFSNNDEFLSRFRNEAEAAESINSENVVATYDYREIPDPAGHTNCFIAMEYVRGESLADLLAREKSLSEDLAMDVLEQAAHGLSIIHRMDLVHRDIKPGNLLITQNGRVKITDFGIAKAAAAVPLTRTGMVVGTAQYVSPEQAQGHNVTSATDVYSLGVVGYEMLAGKRPFSGDSGVSVALAHVNNAPPALPTTISAQARELIGIALRKEPEMRFSNGNEFALAIAEVRAGNRPPQPASAAMNQVAEEPSPTASTYMLGQVAQPTTVHPATTTHPTTNPGAPKAAAATAAPKPAVKKKSNAGKVVLGLAVLAALIGGGVYAATQTDVFERPTPTPTETSFITEWVTETEEETEPAPAPEPAPQPEPAPAPRNDAPRNDAPRETRSPQRLEPPPITSQQPPPPAPQPTQQQPAPGSPESQPVAPAPDNAGNNEGGE